MAPDWAPHGRCWMAWPCREARWDGQLDAASQAFAEVAQAIARFEPVTMVARPELAAMASLRCGPGIAILPLPHDEGWIRHVGPSFLTDGRGELAGVTWTYNGCGERLGDHAQDADLGRRILEHLGIRRFVGGLVLEGGAIQVDGRGTCIAGLKAVLDPRRNPGLSLAEAEAVLCRQLGVAKVIWLPGGLADDETGGHVDQVAMFARPGVVVALTTDETADAAFSELAENLDVLRAATDAGGRTFEVVTVAQPRARLRADGRRLPLSHLSCYLANGAVIMPTFGDPTDKAAIRTFTTLWPDRELVPIDATDIVPGGIGIHGIALGQPGT